MGDKSNSREALPTGKIVKGDSLEVLKTWPSASVQCVVTSPPYW